MTYDEEFPYPPALTWEQADSLAACIGRAFPGWTVWRAHRTWYATCPDPGGLPRTLHAPAPDALCEQLAARAATDESG